MKRTLMILIAIILIFTALSIHVFADDETVVQGNIEAERDDSVVFPQEERDLVQNTENDIIIKIYSGWFIHKFAERTSIDELIYDKDFCLDEIYGIKDKETFKMRQLKHIWKADGKVYEITEYIGGVPDWPYDYMIPKVLSYDEYFSSSNVFGELEDVTVYEVYCLDETPSLGGWYVYYVTSIGDYVYYSEFGNVIEEYFMPVEEFYEFAEKKVTEEYVNRPGVDGGEAGNHNGSEQDDQFNPINLVWIPFVVLAVVAAIFIFLKRKRRST